MLYIYIYIYICETYSGERWFVLMKCSNVALSAVYKNVLTHSGSLVAAGHL